MEISPTTLALITTGSALLGVIVTSFFNLRTTRITKESEERKHQKELVFNAAIENWKQMYDFAKASGLKFKTRGASVDLMPLDLFLVHMVGLSDILFDPNLTADTLKARMAEVDKLTRAMASTVKYPHQHLYDDPYKEVDS
jgi:CO dehydrogenase/acetyl-CoA synthase gamma subunit (corrinoid Fe-S protein)